jgi:ATP-binding cassette subfamily B protein
VFALLVVSKLFNAATPYAFKWATDALARAAPGVAGKLAAAAVFSL